jgi:hypothetical protein
MATQLMSTIAENPEIFERKQADTLEEHRSLPSPRRRAV